MTTHTTTDHTPRAQLDALAHRYRHVHEEHARAHADGRVRRHLAGELAELETRLERLLGEWVPDDVTRAAWREHVYHGGPAPAEPRTHEPLLFRGASEAGSVVEVRRTASAEAAVVVDGTLVERLADEGPFRERSAPVVFRFGELGFAEAFDETALETLATFARAGGRPPWQAADALLTDGLVDSTFAITARGHRALAAARLRPGATAS
jgi:hypothetical protein